MTYRFKKPLPRSVLGPLPPGDYDFVVSECTSPYASPAGNLVLPVRLAIQPEGVPVFDNPWSGTDKNGEVRDGIAEFLLAVNRAPQEGQEPVWEAVRGARGRCRLKIEVAQKGKLAGQEVNKVAFFHLPKQIGPGASTTQELKPIQEQGGDIDPEDDIPF